MRALRGMPKIKSKPPYEFILDALNGLDVHTRRMFGCTAVYVGPKIMFVMYQGQDLKQDVGIWVCIPSDQTKRMKEAFPQLQGVSFFEDPNSAWQCLPEAHPDFEELALKFCTMIRKNDPGIGRLPKSKKKKTKKKPVKQAPPVRSKKSSRV